jgi:hypothetical protein
VGTLISFRVGVEDAQILAREFRPVFDETDLVNLPNHEIYLKLLIDGKPSKPFSAVTLPPQAAKTQHRDDILALSRTRYAKPRRLAEQEIMFRSPAQSQGTSPQQRLV